MYHTPYSSYQYYFHICILGTVLITEVLLGTHICPSKSSSLFTRWMYLLYWKMSCSLFRIRIWFYSQSGCLHVFACDQYLWLEPKHAANYVLMIIYIYVVFDWINYFITLYNTTGWLLSITDNCPSDLYSVALYQISLQSVKVCGK